MICAVSSTCAAGCNRLTSSTDLSSLTRVRSNGWSENGHTRYKHGFRNNWACLWLEGTRARSNFQALQKIIVTGHWNKPFLRCLEIPWSFNLHECASTPYPVHALHG